VLRLALAVLILAVLAVPAHAQDRYSLANGCYALKAPGGKLVAKAADGGYRTSDGGEAFRMQATDLGRYLLYGRDRDFLAYGTQKPVEAPVPVPTSTPSIPPLPNATGAQLGERVQSEASPSDSADWRVDGSDGAFTISLPSEDRALAVDNSGRLVLAASQDAARFAFAPADGCAVYPEPETNVTGAPTKGPTAYGEVSGLVDAHMHMMAFEFLGGRIHCGRPWHRFGAPAALVDCPDHEPGGAGAIGENTLSYGNPVGTHDTRGWPTLKDWPHHASLTHEQSYYKWLERSYRAGLRVFVNLLVDNEVLCTVYPYKKNSCNEMDGVRLQARRIRELQDYIDAQSGGPGKGWFRIVTTPSQARKVINRGKLAVVLGIEVSKLFDCGVQDDKPECTEAQIDKQLDEVYELGVRDMELVNKFDNALGGVAGDTGSTGAVVNAGNRIETGRFWQMGPCADAHNHDKTQPTDPTAPDRDALAGNVLAALLPPGAVPLYGPAPHCNQRGLSPLGEYLVRRMMEKKMIIDPDHLSVVARQKLLDIVESKAYSGIVSSHSWSTPDAIPRIYRLGGMVTPMAGSATEFSAEWKAVKAQRDPRFYYGIGWGADMNGFAHQGDPRSGPNPVTYPFKSFDGKQTIDKQRSGQRVYDINVDGVAHYGLLPDWLEDNRRLAGDEIVRDLGRGAEAYLQMWERATGVPPTRCQAAKARVTRRGLGLVRLRAASGSLLRRAGQPRTRGRAWTWCAKGGRATAVLSRGGRVTTVVSTAPGHRALGTSPGAKAKPGRAIRWRKLPGGRRVAIGVRKGRVRWVAATTAKTRSGLRRQLRVASLR
jgi:microsomal dipeptidase-like Zn-dependent dipeptidase